MLEHSKSESKPVIKFEVDKKLQKSFYKKCREKYGNRKSSDVGRALVHGFINGNIDIEFETRAHVTVNGE